MLMPAKLIYGKLLSAKKTEALELEKAANLSRKTITNAMDRDSSITVETAQKIRAVYPDISFQWLLTGEGSMYIETRRDSVRQVPTEAFMEAPVLTREARAGHLAAAGDPEYIEQLPTMLVPREYEKGNYLVIEVVGDSMEDGTDRALKDGDKVLGKEVPKGDWNKLLPIKTHVFVIGTRAEAPVIKQIKEQNFKKGMLICHSWNSTYEDYAVFMEDITDLYTVKKIVERQIRL